MASAALTPFPTPARWHLAAWAVVLYGLAVRLLGLRFGYPLLVHPDEPRVVEGALGMLQRGDWHPGMFYYPSLVPDLLRVWLGLQELLAGAFLEPGIELTRVDRYLAARLLVALLSAATLACVYDAGRRLFHPVCGLVAAAVLAVAPLHVANSFTATVDACVALCASLVLWCAVRVRLGDARLRWYLLGGACAGLAVGSKYIGFAALLPLLVAHVSRHGVRGWRHPHLLAALALVPLVFLVTTPHALLDPQRFLGDLRSEAAHYAGGHAGSEASGAFALPDYLGYLGSQGLGPLPLALALMGAVLLALRGHKHELALLASFPVLLLVFIGSFKVWFPRNAVGALPGLALCAGAGAWLALTQVRARSTPRFATSAGLMLAVVALVPPLLASLRHVREVTLPDARWASWLWMRENVPAGTAIGLDVLTAPLEEACTRYQVEQLTPERLGELAGDPASGPELVLLSGRMLARVRRGSPAYPGLEADYERFMARHELVRAFEADGDALSGSSVLVYRLRK